MNRTISLLALTLFASAPLMAQTAAEAPVTKPAKEPTTTKPDGAKRKPTIAGIAHVRFLHAAAGAPSVDIYARGDEKIKTGLAFKGLTEYSEVKSGKMTLKLTATGKTDALISGAVTLTKGKYYTVAAYMDGATPAVTGINESSGVEMPDKARVRVVNLVSGSDGVAVVTPSKSAKATNGTANFIAKPVLFGKSSSKTVKPMTQTMIFRDLTGKMLKELPGIKLEASRRYTAFVIGKAGATGADAVDVIVKDAAK